MSLDVYLKDPSSTYRTEPLYRGNITHNLAKMAEKAGVYNALWRPYRLVDGYDTLNGDYDSEMKFEESVNICANDLIDIIEKGLIDLKNRPDYYKQFNSPNGWGIYENFVSFIEKYLLALKEFPESIVSVWR